MNKSILALTLLCVLSSVTPAQSFFGYHRRPYYYDDYYYDDDYGKAALATDVAGGVLGTIFAAKQASDAKKADERLERLEEKLDRHQAAQTQDTDYDDTYYEDEFGDEDEE